MSRLWPERRLAVLTPDAVAVAAQRSFGRCALQTVVSCEGRAGAPAWQASVDALTAESSFNRRSSLSVVLSNRFCRFSVLERPPAISTDAEAHAYAQHRTQAIYGGASGEWSLVLCASGRERLLACSVPLALVSALRELCAAKKARLASIQPFFSAAWRRRARSLRGRGGWFVVHEPKRVVAGLLSNGRWLHLAARNCADSMDGVLDVLDRERELVAAKAAHDIVWLYGPELHAASGGHRDYAVQVIGPPREGAVALDRRMLYAMAA